MSRKAKILIPWLLALVSSSLFILYTLSAGELGFPLDDAWIHQTYARNLARYREWAYVPGHPSAGSTSPLWTLLLSLAYFAGIDFKAWTFALGIAFFGATAWAVGRLVYHLGWEKEEAFLAVCFCALEWHMAWASVSGMEIPLFTFLSLLPLTLFLGGWPFQGRSYFRMAAMGIILGLLCLVRPEGLLLGAILLLASSSKSPLKALAFAGGMVLCLGAYGAFNFHLSGNPFPNTFYAKAAEYRELVERLPVWARFWRVVFPTFVGAQILLLPGLLVGAKKALSSEGRAFKAIPLLWLFLHPLAYALRLPVGYQHGRYAMPVIPILIALGVPGTIELWKRMPRFLAKAWAISTLLLLLAFLFLGAKAYATDVGIIQCEMVNVARWISENTPAGSLIAAHDIGAIGYFSGRDILDLAGLVSPEVIPFIRDEKKLKEFILSRGADYLVTFPSWYPELTQDPAFTPLYSTGCSLTLKAGSDNMVVYGVQKAPFK